MRLVPRQHVRSASAPLPCGSSRVVALTFVAIAFVSQSAVAQQPTPPLSLPLGIPGPNGQMVQPISQITQPIMPAQPPTPMPAQPLPLGQPATTPPPPSQPPATQPPAPQPGSSMPSVLRDPLLSPVPGVGETPKMNAATQAKLAGLVERIIDPETTLDLVVGQTRTMILKVPPFRIQIGEEKVLGLTALSARELILQGKEIGTTVMTIWFGDQNDPTKQRTLSYQVRVFPDPEVSKRLQQAYDRLADQINGFYKDTSIKIKVVGDKVVVTGRVRDYAQGGQILRLLRANGFSGGRQGGGQSSEIPLVPAGSLPDPTNGSSPPSLESFQAAGGYNIINLMEVAGEQQIALRVIVAEVNRAAARSVGLNFSATNAQGATVFANLTGPVSNPISGFGGAVGVTTGTGAGTGLASGTGLSGTNAFSGTGTGGTSANLPFSFNAGRIPFALAALKSLQYARSLQEPTIVTSNGQPGFFSAGGSFPIPVTTGGTITGLQGVQYQPFGVQVNFTPFLTDRDRVRLVLNIVVSDRDLSVATAVGGSNVAGLTSRNVSTTVELRQGETLAVAGLISTNIGGNTARVPFIGDLPYIGQFTGLNQVQSGEKELVIFVTPDLARPIDPNQSVSLPGHEILDPNDFEFYLFNRIEGHCKDYRTPIRTDLSRIRQYKQTELTNLQGPSGYTPPSP